MIRRRLFHDAPDQLKELFEKLRANGDYLVYEDEQQRPVLLVAPLVDAGRIITSEDLNK